MYIVHKHENIATTTTVKAEKKIKEEKGKTKRNEKKKVIVIFQTNIYILYLTIVYTPPP